MAVHPCARASFYRILHIACALIVISYVFFDVLDLDGSNFLRLLTPAQRLFLVAEAVSIEDLPDFREPAVLPDDFFYLPLTDASVNRNWLSQQTRAFPLSPLVFIRFHGYRVGLPRDLVPD